MGLGNDVAYVFRVRAVNIAGAGVPSDGVSATPVLGTPAQPTGLGASAGDARVTLGWDDPDNSSITHFQFQQAAGGGEYGAWTDVPGSDAATITHTVWGLGNDTAYVFRVRAVNVAGAGVPSDGVSVTPVSMPTAPTGLGASAGDARVTLGWDDPDNSSITHFQFQQAEGGGEYGAWADVPGSDAATTTHTVTSLTNDVVYVFRVRAVNVAGAGVASDGVGVTPVSMPTAPTGLGASAGDARVTLGWDDPDDPSITHFQFQQAAGGGEYGAWFDVPGSDATTTTHTVTSLTNDTAYVFRVRAVNVAGAGVSSDGVSVTLVSMPTAPTGFGASAGDARVTLGWDDPDNSSITHFQFQQAAGGGEYGAWADVPGSDATTTAHTVWGLGNDTAYVFRVRAVNVAGAGVSSDGAGVTPVSMPTAPTGLIAEAGDARVTLGWDDPDNSSITHFQFQQAAGGGEYGAWADVPGSDAATTAHTVWGLGNDVVYVFRVRAVNVAGVGVASDGVGVTPVSMPTAPTGLIAEAGDARVRLGWDDPDDSSITGYEYQQAEGGGEYGAWADVPGSDAATTAHTVWGLGNDVVYVFRVRAVNVAGVGVASDGVGVTPVSMPTAPTGLGASAGDARVRLGWDDPDDSSIIGYEYQQAEGGGEYGAWADVPGSDAATTAHTVWGLGNDVVYVFRVRAVNVAGVGVASDGVGVTPVSMPTAPSGLIAEAGDARVRLGWDDPDNPSVIGYQYLQREAGGIYGAWIDVPGSDATTTAHTVLGLTNGVMYMFGVRAVNSAGVGVASGFQTVTAIALPAAPVGLGASVGDARVTLGWDDPDDLSVTGYELLQMSERKLVASDHAAGDFFGRSLAIDPDTVVIGAPLDDDSGIDSGSVYVFIRDSSGVGPFLRPPAPSGLQIESRWNQAAKLTASDAAGYDFFGYSVAVDGDTVMVGGYGDDAESGSVYVFTKPSGGWASGTETAKLVASDRTEGDRFGISVAVEGDTAVIGAPGDDDSGTGSGSVLVFAKDLSGGWNQTVKLVASDSTAGDNFGISVAINSDTALIGANHNGAGSGSAYVFVKPDSGWVSASQAAKLVPSDSTVGDNFGISVAINSDTALIGANHNGAGSGSAYVFVKPDSGWVGASQTAKLVPSDSTVGDNFGISVAINSDTALIGANHNGAGSGSAYVFVKPDSGWVGASQTAKLVPSDSTAGDNFGISAAINNNTALIGTNHNNSTTTTGSATLINIQDWTTIPESNDTTTAHTVTGLTNDTAYAFWVRAVNIAGAGPPSESAHATPMIATPIPKPTTPTGVTAEAGDTQVTLSWDNPTTPP